MKKHALKVIVSLMLVVCMIIPTALVAVSAAASETGYEEDSNWKNTNSKTPTDYAYSFAVVGDTQFMVERDLANGTNYMASIYTWIANNVESKNIKRVLGVGDITEYTSKFDKNFDGSYTYEDEWAHAKAAITILDNKVPYSLCRGGGHDMTANFNEAFANHDYYTSNLSGFYKADDVCNTYSMFEVGSVKYLLFALDWNPSDAVLAWAENIIAANTDRTVIITTHSYLAADGTLHGSSTSHTAVPETNNGVNIYEKLISKYSNIKLVISGHDPSADLVYRQDRREDGSVVTSLLVNPQVFDSDNEAETGMVCMLYFSEDGNTVDVEWFSTVREQFYKESNQFSLDLNNADLGVQTKYGIIPAQYADANDWPFVVFQKKADGNGNDYTFYSANKVLCTDANLGLTANNDYALYKLRNAGEGAVLLMRRDFVNTATADYSNLANNSGANTTFDLGGFVLTDNPTYTTNGLFHLRVKKDMATDVTLNVTNGTLLIGARPLVTHSIGSSSATTSVNLVFDNVTIGFQKGATAKAVFKQANASTKEGWHSITVKNSTVDMSNAPSDATLIPATHNNVVYDIQSTKIITLETKYGVISSEYSDRNEYPFVIFKKNDDGSYTCSGAYNALESGALKSLRTAGEDAVLLMRRDFVNTDSAEYSNWSYTQGESITLDLGGFTLTEKSTHSRSLFFLAIKKHATNTVHDSITVNVTNGTILLGSKALTQHSPNQSYTTTSLHLVFDNVKIEFQKGATAKSVFGSSTGGPDGQFSITVKNSTIDLTNAPNEAKVLAKDSTAHLKFDIQDSTKIIPEPDELKIIGANLNIKENINVKYTVNVPAGYENPYMVFEFNGKTYTVTECEPKDGKLVFMFTGVVPQMIGKNIKATLYATKGDDTTTDVVAEYSVRTYCENMLKKTTDTKLITLLSDLLTYGAASQTYTGDTDALVTNGLTLTPSEFTAVTSTKKALTGTESELYKWNSVALRYENSMAMKLAFTATDVSSLTVKVSINGRTTEYTADDFVTEGSKYVIYFRGILATEYDDVVTASFYDGDTQVGQNAEYTVNSYVYSMQNSTDTALAALVKATYNYGVSAVAYNK